METFSGRSSRPAQPEPQRVAEPEPHHAPVSHARASGTRVAPPKKGGKKKLILAVVAALALVLLLVGGKYAYDRFVGSPIDSSKYQAVFLTNGQVYFGKLNKSVDNYYKLTDVFYLQATQSDAAQNESDAQNPQTASQTGVQLIKLGNEVHGPEDTMVIDRSQVLFIENLKKDGKVVDSINKYKTENK